VLIMAAPLPVACHARAPCASIKQTSPTGRRPRFFSPPSLSLPLPLRRCHLTDFENRLERMNTICCAIPEGCEDQGLCSSIPSALESQWTDAARTCEQNPCSLSGVDTSQIPPGLGPFEMGMAVCLDAAGMHVLDSATGVDSLLPWPFEQPPLGYPEFSTQAGEFANNNHFLCICPSSDPTHPFKSRTMFGDNCQSSTDPCGGDPCPVSQNLVGLTPADVQELPCDSWGEGMAAKVGEAG